MKRSYILVGCLILTGFLGAMASSMTISANASSLQPQIMQDCAINKPDECINAVALPPLCVGATILPPQPAASGITVLDYNEYEYFYTTFTIATDSLLTWSFSGSNPNVSITVR